MLKRLSSIVKDKERLYIQNQNNYVETVFKAIELPKNRMCVRRREKQMAEKISGQ